MLRCQYMGNMGADLFDMTWVQAIVTFFSYLAWALYGTGLVVAAFECGIEARSGRASIKDTALNAIKGFMAVSLFILFQWSCISYQLPCRTASPLGSQVLWEQAEESAQWLSVSLPM